MEVSPAELQMRLRAAAAGEPFLEYRDATGEHRIVTLHPDNASVTVGRSGDCAVRLPGDVEVSRLHAVLSRVGGHWVIDDDGLSRNGTFVGGRRLTRRLRLVDGDLLRIGSTLLIFRQPLRGATQTTGLSAERRSAPALTDAQRRVLIALCRPYKDGAADALPATNAAIAEELVLSVPAVKTHIRALYERFGLESLTQHEKRRRLVTQAFLSGAVGDRDL